MYYVVLNKLIIRLLRIKHIRLLAIKLHKSFAKRIQIDDSLVVIGAMNGLWYGDNAKHLFEHVVALGGVNIVWVTRSMDIYRRLRLRDYPVVYLYSIKGYITTLKAHKGFYTDSLYDLFIHPVLYNSQIQLVALRHGRSVKRVRFARKSHKITEDESEQRRIETNLIRYAISTSEMVSDMQEECLLIGREKHVVTGYPRNDSLLAPTDEMLTKWNSFLHGKSYSKIILYGPSWRHGRDATKFFPFEDFSTSELSRFLIAENILLLIRPHVTEMFSESMEHMKEVSSKIPNNVRIINHKTYNDVNEFLPFIDILISDYSALYHDFLLLDRPILFVPYDYEDFSIKNGFLYDYFYNLPGPSIDSMQVLIGEIRLILSGLDNYSEQRERLKDKIHQYTDSHSCDRVLNLLKNDQ